MTTRVFTKSNNWSVRLNGLIDGNVSAVANSSLNNQQFTFSMWVMLKGPFIGATGGTTSNSALIAYDGNNTPQIRVGSFSSGQYIPRIEFVDSGVTVIGSALCRVAEWQHIAVSYDSVGTWKIYVNGVQKSTGSYLPSGSPKLWVYSSLFPRVGRVGVIYGQMLVDDVTIINRAISSSELETLYSGSSLLPGTVLRWEFEEGAGSTTADLSGRGNTGTLGTGATFTVSRPYDSRSVV
jgi:hypothetical protein